MVMTYASRSWCHVLFAAGSYVKAAVAGAALFVYQYETSTAAVLMARHGACCHVLCMHCTGDDGLHQGVGEQTGSEDRLLTGAAALRY